MCACAVRASNTRVRTVVLRALGVCVVVHVASFSRVELRRVGVPWQRPAECRTPAALYISCTRRDSVRRPLEKGEVAGGRRRCEKEGTTGARHVVVCCDQCRECHVSQCVYTRVRAHGICRACVACARCATLLRCCASRRALRLAFIPFISLISFISFISFTYLLWPRAKEATCARLPCVPATCVFALWCCALSVCVLWCMWPLFRACG